MATRVTSRKAIGPALWASRSHRLRTRASSLPQRVIVSPPVQRKYTTTRSLFSQPLAPKIVRGESKLFASADEAVADLQSGSTILSAGFGLCGVAETLIKAILRRRGDLHSLTAVSNNAGVANVGGLALLADAGQISRLIISFLGNNKTLEKNYLAGKIAIELCPQGTIAERVRAGGAGIPAFYTPTGVSTLLQEGQIPVRLSGEKGDVLEYGKEREVRDFKGRKYLMEEAITGDVAIVRAWKADETGNCVFRYTTKAFGPIMAKAATLTIVEAEEIVPVGSIDPNDVDLPGIFVDRIVPATAEKHIEIQKIRKPENTDAAKEESPEIVSRNRIAKRAAKELKKGYYVNLGVGIPTLAPTYLPKGHTVWVQSENGILGMGAYPTEDEVDPDIINAGKETVTLVPGASTFDSSESFGMIRGGHVDVSILGALQVAANGDLANYMIPGKVFKGMGGAMDLVSNPNNTKIVVATSHVAKDGTSKVVQKCTLPLTGANCVSTIITDLCVFEVDRMHGELTLTELAPGVEVAEIRAKTDAEFHIADDLKRSAPRNTGSYNQSQGLGTNGSSRGAESATRSQSPADILSERPHSRTNSGSAPRTRADPYRAKPNQAGPPSRPPRIHKITAEAVFVSPSRSGLFSPQLIYSEFLRAFYITARRSSSSCAQKVSCAAACRCLLTSTRTNIRLAMAASVEKHAAPEDKFEHAPTREAISQHEGTQLVRNILWKLDIQILPFLALLFLCSFLDRTNVGNAKIIGLEADTGMSDRQYDIGLAVFYLFYVCSEVPSNLVLKKASPKIWLPFLTIVWGIITMCLGFIHSYGSFVAVRALLGIAEGGLLPGMVLYLSSFYRRSDLAIRIGLFYTAASLSGAFGGLLARGLVEIGPRGGLEGWRWIFIIEGLLTVVCGVVAGIFLPNDIGTARYLSPQEREIANDRLLLDKPSLGDGTNSENESFAWSEVFRGLLDISMWLTAIAYFGILAGLYSFGLFLPTIIKGLGIVKTSNEVQLWSVIPYAVATVCTVFVAFLSDRLRLRGVIMLFSLPIAIIGYAVIGNVSNPHVQYGMTFLMAVGMYASVPCILVWNSNNSAGHYKRATTSGMQLAIANCGGFVSTFIYPSKDGPQFHRGHSVVLGLLCFSWLLILCNVIYCRKVNKDKASGKYSKYTGYNDDRDPDFVFIL